MVLTLLVSPSIDLLNGYIALIPLYVGPDQILPLTSLIGALIGIILMFWRYVVGLAGRIWQLLFRR
jgi:hypothetical protein